LEADQVNNEHVAKLREGVATWNLWRERNPKIVPDLSGFKPELSAEKKRELLEIDDVGMWADLRGANLTEANLNGAFLFKADLSATNLARANLSEANLFRANLSKADLRGAFLHRANLGHAQLIEAKLGPHPEGRSAILTEADLSYAQFRNSDLNNALFGKADLQGANFSGANLFNANLQEANLRWADLTGSNLSGGSLVMANLSYANLSKANIHDANLSETILIGTNLHGAILERCRIYGISAWDIQVSDSTRTTDLITTQRDQATVTVDDLEVAQFVYLMLNNDKIRNILTTIGRKGVLILGRFTPERKVVLEGLRRKLRALNFVPMIFDFERSDERSFTETIRILAGMSRFVIADITNPKSAPLELQAVVPDYMVPFVPILQEGEEPFSMFVDLQSQFSWVTKVKVYRSVEQLVDKLEQAIVKPANKLHAELQLRKAQGIQQESLDEF
jgi:uncharacterized protein YjbI with pentapeptide repeats